MGPLERLFARPDGWLGRVGGWIMARTNRTTAAWALDLLHVHAEDRLLEVGFGPGVGLELAAGRATRGRIAGVDPSREMATMAADRNRRALAQGQVTPATGVAEELPFRDDSFTKVLAVNTLPLWHDPEAGLSEIHRVLEATGTVAVAFTPRFADSAEGLPDQLTRVGFGRARRQSGDAGVCVLAQT